MLQLVIAQAGAQGMVALSRALTDPERNKSLQLLKPEQTLQGLLDGAGGLHQQLVSKLFVPGSHGPRLFTVYKLLGGV